MSSEATDAGEPAEESSESYPNVCVVTHPLGAAGENATRTLLDVLAAFTAVSLVTADLPEDSTIRDRYTVREMTKRSAGQNNVLIAMGRFALNQLRMCWAIQRQREEVILFFGSVSYVLPIAWARLLGRTVVVEPRGDVPLTLRLAWGRRMPTYIAYLLSRSVWLLERIGYRLADAIITYTPSMATELELGRFKQKLYPNGARFVDTEQFAPLTPFEERDQVVGYLGRIDEEKGVRMLASIAESLSPGVRFRFVGDGDLTPWLRDRLATELEAGQVELTGWVDHDAVPEELNQLRLLILPSSPTEGLPTTILESLACGTPVYATPVSGIPDVVRDGRTGFLMSQTDKDEIATEIERILDLDDLTEISARGRRLVEEEYDHSAAVNRYRAILRQISEA